MGTWKEPENGQFVDELFLAGERVPSGIYKQVGAGREVRLEQEGCLPADLDGRVACYLRRAPSRSVVRTRATRSRLGR